MLKPPLLVIPLRELIADLVWIHDFAQSVMLAYIHLVKSLKHVGGKKVLSRSEGGVWISPAEGMKIVLLRVPLT